MVEDAMEVDQLRAQMAAMQLQHDREVRPLPESEHVPSAVLRRSAPASMLVALPLCFCHPSGPAANTPLQLHQSALAGRAEQQRARCSELLRSRAQIAQLRFANADLAAALEATRCARFELAQNGRTPSSPSAHVPGSAVQHAKHADAEGVWMWPSLSSHGYMSSTAIRRLACIGTRMSEPSFSDPEVANLFSDRGDRIPWT